MENLIFRKKLFNEEIDRLTKEMEKNQEFINLFQKNNNEILKQIKNKFFELDAILNEQLNDNTK